MCSCAHGWSVHWRLILATLPLDGRSIRPLRHNYQLCYFATLLVCQFVGLLIFHVPHRYHSLLLRLLRYSRYFLKLYYGVLRVTYAIAVAMIEIGVYNYSKWGVVLFIRYMHTLLIPLSPEAVATAISGMYKNLA
jgi:hypothetical protein